MLTTLSALLHKRYQQRGSSGSRAAMPSAVAANGRGPARPAKSQPADAADLIDFICSSPLLPTCGITRQEVEADVGQWAELGDQVIANLGFPPRQQLLPAQRRRIFHYYLPVFFWCQRQLQRRAASSSGAPLVLGISAPQGCGKTTLCEQLEALFAYTGAAAASISIDDFYHTYQGQQAVAAAHPGNPLLQMRGNAGSHDMQLGTDTLRALRSATEAGARVPIPRYDKSAYNGMGDRADPASWPLAVGPLDVVLFEGWMLGFTPVEDEQAGAVDPNLVSVNTFLRSYREAWDSFVDAWLVVKVAQPDYAFRWRLQAEQAMRLSGRAAMSDEQVASFVARFMPAYRCYLPGLYSAGPTTAAPGRLLVVEVNEVREPVAEQPPPIM